MQRFKSQKERLERAGRGWSAVLVVMFQIPEGTFGTVAADSRALPSDSFKSQKERLERAHLAPFARCEAKFQIPEGTFGTAVAPKVPRMPLMVVSNPRRNVWNGVGGDIRLSTRRVSNPRRNVWNPASVGRRDNRELVSNPRRNVWNGGKYFKYRA